MIALVVTAHMASPYSTADPWSPALDGILAYWATREALGEEEFALGMTGHRELVEVELPLARVDGGGTWWWACSSPLVKPMMQFDTYTHRRFDDAAAATYTHDSVRKVLTAGGPYKIYRTRHVRILAPWMRWHVIGDADEIKRLLRRCHNVGAGHTRGWGQVSEWTVEPGGDPQKARFLRPVPMAFAADHLEQLGTGTRLVWGIRPPGRRPEQQALCFMPELP